MAVSALNDARRAACAIGNPVNTPIDMSRFPIAAPSLRLTLSSRFLRAFFDETQTGDPDQLRLLERVGISIDTLNAANGRITEDQFSRLYRLMAAERNDEMLGLLSSPVPGGTMKYTGYVIITAPTVAVALYRHSRFIRMLIRDYEVVVRRERDTGVLSIVERPETGGCKIIGLQLQLKVFHGMMCWLIGRNVPLVAVDFTFDAPPYLDDLNSLFPGPLRFNQPQTLLRFDAALLDMKFQRTEQELRTFLLRQPSDWLCSPDAKQPVAHQVRTCLLEGDMGSLGAAEVAKALNTSLRTLSRRLEHEQTSVKQIKETLRRDLAIHRLTQTGDAISEIAADLGFRDIASFYRAFRQWTGVAPGLYRRERRATATQ
jgi:AraC-like DNA-binding protein